MRPWITAALDFRCRRWMAFVIVEVPSSDSIATVLKKTFIRHGLPRAVLIDNGRDFRCSYFEGKAETHRQAPATGEMKDGWPGIFESLGIRVHHAIVKNARSKIIEPAFRALASSTNPFLGGWGVKNQLRGQSGFSAYWMTTNAGYRGPLSMLPFQPSSKLPQTMRIRSRP